MPFIKISGLTTATAVSATNQFEINQNGASRSLQVSVLDSYIRSGSPLPVVVSVSSASNALRITQTGTGNALVVEDSTNPDSTPFVVNASGQVLVATTAAVSTGVGSAAMQIFGGTAPLVFYRQADATTPINLEFAKARAAGAILASGDTIGRLYFSGSDGTAQIPAAYIDAAVDGTPGTNDMPGRLVFSTTPDGASTPTERMRIDSSGDVGIGTTTPTARLNVVDATSQDAVRITQTGAGNALVIEDAANPDATPFVVEANGRLIVGATSTEPSLGTTNTPQIGVFGNSASNNGFANYSYVNSTSGSFFNFAKSRSTTPGSFSILSDNDDFGYIKFIGDDGTQFLEAARVWAEVDDTPGTGDMPGRLLFSTTADGASTPTERMRIDNQGRVGIGTSTLAAQRMRVEYSISDATSSSVNILANGTHTLTADNALYYAGVSGQAALNQGGFNATVSLPSGGSLQSYRTLTQVTGASGTVTAAVGVLADVRNTGAGTLTNGVGFNAAPVQNSGGGTLTNAMGFYAATQTNGVNNYGFYSNTASGTNRWNFYANGTADNYFAGPVQLSAGTAAAPALSAFGDTNTGMFFPAADTIAFSEGGVEAMRLDSSGNVLIGTTTANALLTVNGVGPTLTSQAFAFYAELGGATNTGYASGQTITNSIWASNRVSASEFNARSDARLKQNITPIPASDAWQFVQNVTPIHYKWINNLDDGHKFGFLAQDIVKAGFPNLVGQYPDSSVPEVTDADGFTSPAGVMLSVNYDQIVPVLASALRDALTQIEDLKARVAALENK